MGLAGELLPRLNVSRNIRHVSADGKLLLLIARSGVGPEGWNNAYRFYQPELEAVLRDGVSRFPSVDVRLRSDAFALDETRDHVRIRYEDLAVGKALRSDGPLCRRLRWRALDGAALHGRRAARPAFARALDRARHDPRPAARRCAGSRRRNRPGRSMRSSIAIRRGRRHSCRCPASATAGNSC